MPRIQPVDHASATGKQKEILDAAKAKLGGVPNIIASMANAPAGLNAYMQFSGALAGGSLDAKVREQIALTVANTNGCGYCASAHTAIGKGAGLKDDELAAALDAHAADPKTAAALRFARTLVEKRGWASDADMADVRKAGWDDGAITEIVANVALNLFTNYFNHVAQTDIDFPQVEVKQPAHA